MKIFQTPTFHRAYKKLHKKSRETVDGAITALIKNPELGELKRGDLPDFRVYKFKEGTKLWLLAYNYETKYGLQLIDLGSHQNFYKKLKREL